MSKWFDITLVTYDAAPYGAPDDQVLASAIRDLGGRTRFAVWDDPDVDWSASVTTIIRSTWDYFRKVEMWLGWLRATDAVTRLVNSADIMRWNMDKSYLLDLARGGVAIVPTVIVPQAEPLDLRSLCADRGWSEIVVKPAMAGSAYGAGRFGRDDITKAAAHLHDLILRGDALIQPYQPAVEHERERSLVFIGGAFRHAYTKGAFDPGAAAGRSDERDHQPTNDELVFAAQAIEAVGAPVTYARVDLVPTPEGLRLMELELIEPHLGLRHHPDTGLELAKRLLDNDC